MQLVSWITLGAARFAHPVYAHFRSRCNCWLTRHCPNPYCPPPPRRYWKLLADAKAEGRIVGVQNMYNTYFRTLQPFPPYFDGDFWPTEVERLGLTPRMRRKPRSDEASSSSSSAARPRGGRGGGGSRSQSPQRRRPLAGAAAAAVAASQARDAFAASVSRPLGASPRSASPGGVSAASSRSVRGSGGGESPRYVNGTCCEPSKSKPSTWPDIPLGAAEEEALASIAPETVWLRQQAADAVGKMHNDFMVAQLHHVCCRCAQFILKGSCWHDAANGLSFCARCYGSEQDKHGGTFEQVQIKFKDTATQATDPDASLACEFVDSRHVFLKTCEYHHYQFDTLRRAKHSTMMVLHHVQHPDPTALTRTCDNCRQTITSIVRWSCGKCENYDLCEQCRSHNIGHEHCGSELVPLPNLIER